MRKPVRKTARKTVPKTTAAPRTPKPTPASARESTGLLTKGNTRRGAATTESTLDERSHRTLDERSHRTLLARWPATERRCLLAPVP